MPEKRSTSGVPLPTLRQLLLISSAACAGWLIWSHWEGLFPRSPVEQNRESDQLAAALDHLHTLEVIAQRDPDGLPRLIAELANSNPRMRRNALLALQRLGPAAHDALDLVRERLADADPPTRRSAIDAYWHIRCDPDDVARTVAPLLGDEDSEARLVAANVLETLGPPAVGPVTDLLGGDVERTKVLALQVLRRIDWGDSQVQTEDAIRRLVRDPSADVRFEALMTLAECGQPTSTEIRELLQRNPSPQVGRSGWRNWSESQSLAFRAIVRLGPAAAENLPDILALLSEGGGSLGQAPHLVYLLQSMKSAALPAAPLLFQAFRESQDSFRFEVAWVLLEIGADPDEVARLLIPLLSDSKDDIRFMAGRLCARASPEEARRQVAVLIPQLSDRNRLMVRSALQALRGLAPEAGETVPVLTRLLENPDPQIVRPTVMALGEIGPAAVPAVPALRALLAVEPPKFSPAERPVIFEALRKIGPSARSAIPELLAELESYRFGHVLDTSPNRVVSPHQERPLELTVIWALASIGGTEPAVHDALRKLLSRKITGVRRVALEALLESTPESPDMLGDLLKWLSEGNEEGRLNGILAVGLLEGDRRAAVPILMRTVSDPDPMIRKAAAWALGTIGPEAGAALPTLHQMSADWKNSFVTPRPRNRSQPAYHSSVWSELSPRQNESFRRRSGEARNRLEPLSVQQVVREAIAAIDGAVSPE